MKYPTSNSTSRTIAMLDIAKKEMIPLIFLVFFLCTFGRTDSSITNSTMLAQLPELLSYLCPGVDVCGQMYELSDTDDQESLCCTACSCNSDCEVNSNCCFRSTLPYSSDDSGMIPVNNRDCLYPTTLVLREGQKLLYQPYYMITAVPSDTLCGETYVAFWGSFFPVYSSRKNEIYKNIACADADDVTDGVHWDVILYCNFENQDDDTNLELGPITNIYELLEQGSFFDDWNCHVNFRIGDIDLESHKCYTDVIDDCLEPGLFQIPHDVNMSAKDITKACSSGLVSPYRRNKMYANAFCFICNNETYDQDNACSQTYDIFNLRGAQGFANFFGLLDTDISLQKDLESKPATIAAMTQACDNSKQNEKDCRQIHCPLGQNFDQFGKCKYFISRMYKQVFLVIVNVTTDVYLNVTDILDKNTMTALISPWPELWMIQSVSQIETPTNMNVTHLRIALVRVVENIGTAHFMDIIKNHVKQEWSLKDLKNIYFFQSELPTWDYVWSLDHGSILDDIIHIGDRTRYISFPLFSYAFFHPSIAGLILRSSYQTISRLHYCILVELNSSEFVLSKNKTALFNVRTQRLMFGIHSFEIRGKTEIGEPRVRICIEDSGLSVENKAPASSLQVSLWVLSSFYLQMALFDVYILTTNTYNIRR